MAREQGLEVDEREGERGAVEDLRRRTECIVSMVLVEETPEKGGGMTFVGGVMVEKSQEAGRTGRDGTDLGRDVEGAELEH